MEKEKEFKERQIYSTRVYESEREREREISQLLGCFRMKRRENNSANGESYLCGFYL